MDECNSARSGNVENGFGETSTVGRVSRPGTMSDVVISKRAFRNSFALFNSVGHEMVHVAQHYAGLPAHTPFLEYGAYDWNRFVHNFEGIPMQKSWREALSNSLNEAMQMNANWMNPPPGQPAYSPVSILDYLWYNLDFKFNFSY